MKRSSRILEGDWLVEGASLTLEWRNLVVGLVILHSSNVFSMFSSSVTFHCFAALLIFVYFYNKSGNKSCAFRPHTFIYFFFYWVFVMGLRTNSPKDTMPDVSLTI